MANEGGIRAGRAFVELFADDSKLVRGMQSAEAKLRAFGASVASIGSKMMLGGMGIVGSLFGASKVYADVGSRIKDMSDRTGMGAVAIQELAYAAEQSGADMASLETGVRKMQRAIVEAGQGAKAPADALRAIGLSAAELAGKSPDRQLALIGARLTAIDDPAAKAAAAMELFGKSGTALLPMLADMGQLQAEFRDKGLGMSAEDVAAAEAYGDALSGLQKSFQAIIVAVGGAVAPILKRFAESASETAVAVRRWVDEHHVLLGNILKFGPALLAGGAAVVTFGKAIAGLATAFKIARVAMVAFSAHPLIAILTAVAAGVLLIVHKFSTEAPEFDASVPQPSAKELERAKADAARRFNEDVRTAAAYYRRNPNQQKTLNPNSEFDTAILDLLAKEKQEADAIYAAEIEERQRIAGLNERLQDELHRLKIAGIEDEYQREWQSIQATYDEKVRAAEKSGADIELIEMARTERLAQLNRKQAEKDAAEDKRFREDLFRTETDLQDEIDRLKIDTDKSLTPEQKNRQQMELRHANELRALRASGMDDGKNVWLLLQKQELEAKQLAMADQMPGALRQSVAGTFNATVAGRMGASSPLDRIARATERTEKHTAEMAKQRQQALALK